MKETLMSESGTLGDNSHTENSIQVVPYDYRQGKLHLLEQSLEDDQPYALADNDVSDYLI